MQSIRLPRQLKEFTRSCGSIKQLDTRVSPLDAQTHSTEDDDDDREVYWGGAGEEN